MCVSVEAGFAFRKRCPRPCICSWLKHLSLCDPLSLVSALNPNLMLMRAGGKSRSVFNDHRHLDEGISLEFFTVACNRWVVGVQKKRHVYASDQ